jgi:hypothetical protein
MENVFLTSLTTPEIRQLFKEELSIFFAGFSGKNCMGNHEQLLTKFVDINGAAEITSKTPNALRVQISLGNLKSTKKGSRHYFEREYLEKWIAGEQNVKGASDKQ